MSNSELESIPSENNDIQIGSKPMKDQAGCGGISSYNPRDSLIFNRLGVGGSLTRNESQKTVKQSHFPVKNQEEFKRSHQKAVVSKHIGEPTVKRFMIQLEDLIGGPF